MASWRLKHPSTRVGQWSLNGHALDVSGHGKHGTWAGTEAYGSGPKGMRQAAVFGGPPTLIDCGDHADRDGGSALTVTFWTRGTPLVGRAWISKGGAADRSWLFNSLVGGLIRFYVASVPGAWHSQCDSTTAINDGGWHHVAGVYDGAFEWIGIDGKIDSVLVAGPAALNASDDPLEIGAWDGGNQIAVDIADVRIYSCALTIDEIIAIIHEAVPVLA